MADLLSGLDDSFFNAIPTPDPSPQKNTRPASALKSASQPLSVFNGNNQALHADTYFEATYNTPTSLKYTDTKFVGMVQDRDTSVALACATEVKLEDVDMVSLFDGAESWDWDDMNDDFMSPKKAKSKVRSSIISSMQCVKDFFVRCPTRDVTTSAQSHSHV